VALKDREKKTRGNEKKMFKKEEMPFTYKKNRIMVEKIKRRKNFSKE
jgi:hypothetical protein